MWGCRGPKGEGEIGRREGGHPLKRQRGTGRGETRRRAKDDARRTKKVLDQWEGREKNFGEKTLDKRGSDWRGGGIYGEGGLEWGKEVGMGREELSDGKKES